MHCSRHTLIGLFGHCPEAKTHFTVSNPKHGFKGCQWVSVSVNTSIQFHTSHDLPPISDSVSNSGLGQHEHTVRGWDMDIM